MPKTTALQLRDPELLPDVSGAESDSQLVALWLQGRSPHTTRAYARDAQHFLDATRKPLHQVSVADLQAFAGGLEGSPATQARTLSAVKSLLSYGQRVGYLPFNIGVAVKLPKGKSTLAERILPEAAVVRMLALESSPRNHALLVLLYAGGLRVSELCQLRARDLQPRNDAGQVTVLGKGGKTRAVLLSATTWGELAGLVDGAAPNDPVFRSRKGGALHTSTIWRIVRAAAKRAGIEGNVSPHWLRHCHASHALERGAPAHLVQATLGHSSLTVTSVYTHARPTDSSARYLAV